MTRKEFEAAPWLVMEHHLAGLGYGRATLGKFVDCGTLNKICPKGCGQGRYQKRQIAHLVKWPDCLAEAVRAFGQEPALMPAKAVMRWTGWSDTTLGNIAGAGGLSFVKPPGAGQGKFLKDEVAKLIGF